MSFVYFFRTQTFWLQKMKLKIALTLLALVLVQGIYSASDEKYTTKYDGIEIEEVLRNERLLKNYVNCLMGAGPCTRDGDELKRIMPDALETNCSKCSEKQKDMSSKVVAFLIDNRPDYWKPLQEKYDPESTYTNEYIASKSVKVVETEQEETEEE